MSKLILTIGLLAACLFPVGTTARANEGHHQSGMFGQIVGLPTFVTECNIEIVSSDGGTLVADVQTDSDLRFEVALKPGVYTMVLHPISPIRNLYIPPSVPFVFHVGKKVLAEMLLNYTPRPF
jgi:hypothetical protein